jgi:hypothetical protein
VNDISPISNRDLTKAIREAAMLADVSLSMWEASQNDPDLMDEVKRTHGARGDVGKVIKYLMTGADSQLKRTRNAFKAVQARHKELTLPWVSNRRAARVEGPRLLPHLLVHKYEAELGERRREAYAELDEFVASYPDLIIQAKSNLGTMVTDRSYPSPEEVKAKFNVHFDFWPVPDSEQFGAMDDHMLERFSKHLKGRQDTQAQIAQEEMWRRVKAPVEHLIERLTTDEEGESKMFKAASIEAVRDLITMLPGWNVTGNPVADEIARDIDVLLTGLDAETLRKNDGLRKETASESQKIIDKLAKWGL